MQVRSALANMDVAIGGVSREGNELVLASGPGSSIDAVIRLSAREVVAILGRVLGTRAGLGFVLGLPVFWVRQTLAGDVSRPPGGSRSGGPADINKPW